MTNERENSEVYAATKRMIVAAGKRAAEGDTTDLTAMLELRSELDAAIAATAKGLNRWYGWQELANAAGITKAAAWKRWK